MPEIVVWVMKVQSYLQIFLYLVLIMFYSVISTGLFVLFNKEPGEQKWEYLVKYKGLAHAHNFWIKEEQLRLEDQAAFTRFKNNHMVLWLS